jgi:hypothetical protein
MSDAGTSHLISGPCCDRYLPLALHLHFSSWNNIVLLWYVAVSLLTLQYLQRLHFIR